jgi:hypothetical protein
MDENVPIAVAATVESKSFPILGARKINLLQKGICGSRGGSEGGGSEEELEREKEGENCFRLKTLSVHVAWGCQVHSIYK